LRFGLLVRLTGRSIGYRRLICCGRFFNHVIGNL
jgi:hypothetical protein